MPSMVELFMQEFKKHSILTMVTVPPSQTQELYFAMAKDKSFAIIHPCREGEGVALASGLELGGRHVVLDIQSLGFFESIDTLRAMPIDMQIPLMLLIGYLGRVRPGQPPAPTTAVSPVANQVALAGKWTEPMLKEMDIPYYIIDGPGDVKFIGQAHDRAHQRLGPTALLIENLPGE